MSDKEAEKRLRKFQRNMVHLARLNQEAYRLVENNLEGVEERRTFTHKNKTYELILREVHDC